MADQRFGCRVYDHVFFFDADRKMFIVDHLEWCFIWLAVCLQRFF
jgi:hypothetical protein